MRCKAIRKKGQGGHKSAAEKQNPDWTRPEILSHDALGSCPIRSLKRTKWILMPTYSIVL